VNEMRGEAGTVIESENGAENGHHYPTSANSDFQGQNQCYGSL